MKVLPETVPILGLHSQPKGSQLNNNSISLELTWSHKDNINKKKTANRLQVTTGCPDEDDDQEKNSPTSSCFMTTSSYPCFSPGIQSEATLKLWRKAIYISLLSFISSMILCIAGVVLSSLRSSASTAAFAADCFLDALTSIIIFWRYMRAIRGKDSNEHLACIYLGVLLIVSAAAITGKAIADVVTQEPDTGNSQWLLWLSVSGSFVFISTAGLKYWLYKLLQNDSILVDAVNTLLSGLFCAAIVVTVIIVDFYPYLWYLDPLEGGVFGLFMGVYGVKCIIDNTSCFNLWKKKNVLNEQRISRLPSKADFWLSATNNTCEYYIIP